MKNEDIFIPPPVHWQKFEELCHALWQTEWECPNIQWNGRAGQRQNGVDIFGIPSGKSRFSGIQCKLLSQTNLRNLALDEREIRNDVEKAKNFSPPLEWLIFASTGISDAYNQSVARSITAEHMEKNLFGVDILAWPEIKSRLLKHPSVFTMYYPELSGRISITTSREAQRSVNVESLSLSEIERITSTFLRIQRLAYGGRSDEENATPGPEVNEKALIEVVDANIVSHEVGGAVQILLQSEKFDVRGALADLERGEIGKAREILEEIAKQSEMEALERNNAPRPGVVYYRGLFRSASTAANYRKLSALVFWIDPERALDYLKKATALLGKSDIRDLLASLALLTRLGRDEETEKVVYSICYFDDAFIGYWNSVALANVNFKETNATFRSLKKQVDLITLLRWTEENSPSLVSAISEFRKIAQKTRFFNEMPTNKAWALINAILQGLASVNFIEVAVLMSEIDAILKKVDQYRIDLNIDEIYLCAYLRASEGLVKLNDRENANIYIVKLRLYYIEVQNKINIEIHEGSFIWKTLEEAAQFLRGQKEYDLSSDIYARLAVAKEHSLAETGNARDVIEVAISFRTVADVEKQSGRHEEARVSYMRAKELIRAHLGDTRHGEVGRQLWLLERRLKALANE